MWIKICGNTNLEDALLAAQLGADAVGFVFAPGKRTVTAAQVAAITPHLPPELEKIGVFTTGSFTEILETAHHAGLTGVQLHGAFAPALLGQLRAALPPPQKVIQVLHWSADDPGSNHDFDRQVRDLERNAAADAVLVDTSTRSAAGGTGTTFDWLAAAPALTRLSTPVIVAGGLHAANVGDAIAALRPWGVDVASGVELGPGRKDAHKLRAFLQAARSVTAPAGR